ncbi:hypothetical protein SRM1_02679 [Pseudomonas fluorescens]|nr:hypothetical protein SRM1_02679 [Pseudomonas fluorescens]
MLWSFWKDKRPEWIQAEEREFIKAVNSLKTLQTTPRGGMKIDPEELRDQILASRERYKELVKK